MAIKLLIALFVLVEIIKHLTILVPKVGKDHSLVGSSLVSIMLSIVGLFENSGDARKNACGDIHPSLQVEMRLSFGHDWGPGIVIHARSKAILGRAASPSERVRLYITFLCGEEPLNVQLEVVVDFAQEDDKLVIGLFFE